MFIKLNALIGIYSNSLIFYLFQFYIQINKFNKYIKLQAVYIILKYIKK